jgi:hypothetical protein
LILAARRGAAAKGSPAGMRAAADLVTGGLLWN